MDEGITQRLYKLVRPLFFAEDPETAHRQIMAVGKMLSRPWITNILSRWIVYENPRLETDAFGIHFKNPVGLAAGFDKNGRLINFLPALGFGHLEVGTITPLPQEGNPLPRLFRLVKDQAIINRMGFNNMGAKIVAERLSNRDAGIPVGVNIGKNRMTPIENAFTDYEKCFKAVADGADYVAVNVSSPNTPHLRELQDKGPLMELLRRLTDLNRNRAEPTPILLKISPDLTDGQLDDIVEIVKRLNLDGIIATNTTTARDNLQTDPGGAAGEAGGLSGKPLRKRSTGIIRYLYSELRGDIPIIGVGGIFTARDAYEKIRAGAALVQVYTGLIYEGPTAPAAINRGLVELMKRDGITHIGQAVGKDA